MVHAGRPEWGTGVVTSAQNVQQNGAAVQRLTLRFDRAGLKTLATPPADLRPADAPAEKSAAVDPEGGENRGWLAEVEASGKTLGEVFSKLPEACGDPFASLASRIEATLKLYRFNDSGSALLDWAAMQTGLADPLGEFARHELEQQFPRFAEAREKHLRALLREVRESDTAAVRAVVAKSSPEGRAAVKRAYGKR